MEEMLSIKELYGGYPAHSDVIQGITMDVAGGEFVGIIGPNGCGKSTLIKLLTKVLPCNRGRISFNSRSLAGYSFKEFSRMAAVVSQDVAVDMPFRVEEVVAMGRTPYLGRLQTGRPGDRAAVESAMELTDTQSLRRKYLSELSFGERQRVMVALALAQEPQVLFLDEPTSHLDIGHQAQIMDLLVRLNRTKSLTVIVVMHDLNLASEYCRRLILLQEGKVVKDGKVEEVLTYENIEAVYKTVVVVKQNPISKKPHVMLVPEELCQRD